MPAAVPPPRYSTRSSSSSPSAPSFSTRNRSNLSLDLASLPPLELPTPPSNTLLFTNLHDPDVFTPDGLAAIRGLIAFEAPIHAFAPLKSFRRIVVSFFDEQAALRVRQAYDGTTLLGHQRVRVYFGQPTPVQPRDEHLALPDAGKLFFISPPPSPPAGWEMRLEDAPNKLVHADDLADALARLHHDGTDPTSAYVSASCASPASPLQQGSVSAAATGPGHRRSRSSTLIYRPDEHGHSPDLPAVIVEDMTDEASEMGSSSVKTFGPIPAHTARPPVELPHGS